MGVKIDAGPNTDHEVVSMYRISIRAAVVAAFGVCAAGQTGASELILVKESAVAALMAESEDDDELEASGVYALDGHYYLVFDNEDVITTLSSTTRTSSPSSTTGLGPRMVLATSA